MVTVSCDFDIIDMVMEYGDTHLYIEMEFQPLNVVFGMFAFTSSTDEPVKSLGKIQPYKFFKYEERYKVVVCPEDPNLSPQSFYVDDLNRIIRDGHARAFVIVSKLNDEEL